MRRSLVGLVLAVLLTAHAAPVAARHGVAGFDPRRPTPGVQLTLVERPTASPTGTPAYRLVATGVPRGVLFGIWTKDFGGPFQQVASGFRVGDTGALETIDGAGQPRRLEEIVFDPGSYPRGAAWEIALVSADHAVVAVTKVTPRPIAARNGGCGVSLELASRRGDRFIVTTQGFEPGAAIVVELQQAGASTRKPLYVPPEGRMPLDVVSHGTAGPDHRARYAVKGAACEVAVDYAWGEPALASSSVR